MRRQSNSETAHNTFTAYGDDYVRVNATRHTDNIIVMPSTLIERWTAHTFDTLTLEDMQQLAALPTEIILFGTGHQLRFPRPELMQPLIAARKGLDVMDLHAACRAYNILAAEGRSVAAALLLA